MYKRKSHLFCLFCIFVFLVFFFSPRGLLEESEEKMDKPTRDKKANRISYAAQRCQKTPRRTARPGVRKLGVEEEIPLSPLAEKKNATAYVPTRTRPNPPPPITRAFLVVEKKWGGAVLLPSSLCLPVSLHIREAPPLDIIWVRRLYWSAKPMRAMVPAT